ncbi:MAG: exodeoxyribonuclease VII large subunit [Planctomycetes bacterium]|nr:exodeoxyribonuclease VII large subunit [Planctomycetota bacterium]
MTGTVELDADGANLVIRFPYRADLVTEVKLLKARRFDPRQKTWLVPASDIDQVFAMFKRHLFEFAPDVMSLLAGTLGKPAATKNPPAKKLPVEQQDDGRPSLKATAATTAAPDALSVSALNERVREALRGKFPQSIWVVGEIVDFDKQGQRATRFFTLIEKAQGESRPLARVDAILFERTLEAMLLRLNKTSTDFTLRDGLEVRMLVRVDLYPQTGRYQLIVEDIDPSFTLGKLALSREQILRELRDAGLAERNLALGLVIPPLRIGVLTSPDSDGWNDFLRHLQDARTGFDITLLPVSVQGALLRDNVLNGLAWFAARANQFDALCILRGGGSRTDLAGFDDRDIAFAVARHPIKIVIGIGHQRDRSILDEIAHSEKTPTAVAEFLVRCVEDARSSVRERAAHLQGVVIAHLLRASRDLDHSGHLLNRSARTLLQEAKAQLQTIARDVHRESLRCLTMAGSNITRSALGLSSAAFVRCARARSEQQNTASRLIRAAERRLEQGADRLEQKSARQRLLDPARVLGRGFALIRSADGRILSEAARIHPNQTLVLQLRDGTVHTKAESINLEPTS